MCGIVGYIGDRNATPIILNGLKKLEYRGYDSAGIAVLQNKQIEVRRDAGKLANLTAKVSSNPISGKLGIGHTRWATHGEPSARNAHPHLGMTGDVVVVHNGIVENFNELREELSSEGVTFNSDTDSETIVHLVEKYLALEDDLFIAVGKALKHLKGAHGVVVMSRKHPEMLIAALIGNAGGIVIGVGKEEMFIASDLPAILEHTRNMIFLDSHQVAAIRKKKITVHTIEGDIIEPEIHNVPWDPVSAEKGEYRHFMHKEIHEQVRSITDTLAGRVAFESGKIRLPQLNLSVEQAKKINKIFITACGTAAHAGMVGKILIERIARIPVELSIASEFRYNDPIVAQNDVVLAISQSGETADTLAAMEEGRNRGALLWAIVNALGSVASTKAFTAPLVNLYMLAVLLADLRGVLNKKQINALISDLRLVPDLVGRCLDREGDVLSVAEAIQHVHNILYLGRGINMPIAYEGALKLKEISYIHAEAYPAGEMKHGPIALIDQSIPVIALALKDPWYEKMISQIEQAKARGGIVIAVGTDGDDRLAGYADHIIQVPDVPWLLSPIITVIPLQLLAYHIAALRGLDVDQPRNLAKSVTVE